VQLCLVADPGRVAKVAAAIEVDGMKAAFSVSAWSQKSDRDVIISVSRVSKEYSYVSMKAYGRLWSGDRVAVDQALSAVVPGSSATSFCDARFFSLFAH
jgi:hypothetical protein